MGVNTKSSINADNADQSISFHENTAPQIGARQNPGRKPRKSTRGTHYEPDFTERKTGYQHARSRHSRNDGFIKNDSSAGVKNQFAANRQPLDIVCRPVCLNVDNGEKGGIV